MNSVQGRALFIGSVWPEPTSSAAGWRTLSILQSLLDDGWAITFASTAADTPHRYPLKPLGILELRIALNDPSFDTFVAELDPELVVFDRFMVEEQFGWRVAEHCPNALRILDTQDLHCLRDARHTAIKQGRGLDHGPVHTSKAFREIASIHRSDLSLIISSFEIDWLRSQFGVATAQLHHLPFMFEPLDDTQVAAWPGFEERQHYLSIGNFRHPPNWDAVQYLKQTLWPLVRARQPEAQLHIYGAYPGKAATQLHAPDEGFHVLGWADDSHGVLRKARICLAPLRFGAGLKGKLAEAMQCGTPSVTTPVGAEGMHGRLPWNGAIETEAEALADAAVWLYHDRQAWQVCQQQGRNILGSHFDKPRLQAEWIRVLHDRLRNRSRFRQRNFTGAMLHHHSLLSSRYLARWIEAKNKGDE